MAYPQYQVAPNPYQIAGEALQQGSGVLDKMNALIEKRKQNLIAQRNEQIEADRKEELRKREDEKYKREQDEIARQKAFREKIVAGREVPAVGPVTQTGASPVVTEPYQPQEILEEGLREGLIDPLEYAKDQVKKGVTKYQKFPGDDGYMHVFDPSTGSERVMLNEETGTPVSAREYYRYLRGEGGEFFPVSTTRPPVEQPQAVPGIRAKGTEKSNLQKQKLETQIEDIERENVLGRDVPASQAVELGGAAQAISSLDKLEGVIPNITTTGVFTPITDPIRGLNPWDTQAQAKKQYIASIKQTIGKGLEGGVLRAEDERKYDKIIPKVGDSPEVFQKKLDQLREMIKDKREFMLKSLESARFNVSGFEDMTTPVKKTGKLTQKQRQLKAWAKKNPGDPRATAILNKFGE